MKFKRTRKELILFFVIFIGSLSVFFSWQNNSIVTNEIEFKNSTITDAFNGFKILHLSDLHNKMFGENQNHLLAKIEKINPDIIVFTGDLIDSNHPDIAIAMDLMDAALDIAPIFYVSGNHEAWSGLYDDLRAKSEASGVVVLDNQTIDFFNKDSSISIIGLSDPSFTETGLLEEENPMNTENTLNALTKTNSSFNILLSHRPELFNLYSSKNIDLVFSGHAHGGQIRLPFIGGLVAPNQGFFPNLSEGMHTSANTSMVISRGLGNSVIP